MKTGGSVKGYIQALDTILTSVPPNAVVVPGHGEVTDLSGVRAFRRYLVDLQEAAAKARADGRTRDAFVTSIELPAYREFDGYPRRLRDNAGAAYDEAR